jgi:hypothetical protein
MISGYFAATSNYAGNDLTLLDPSSSVWLAARPSGLYGQGQEVKKNTDLRAVGLDEGPFVIRSALAAGCGQILAR